MSKIVLTALYALAGAIVFGAVTLFGGLGLAMLSGQEAQAALGMIVPMLAVPAAALVGAVLGGRRGWRRAA